MSLSQSAGFGSRSDQPLEAVGDGLDRRQRVVDLVADDADEPLPRLTFLVAQRAADVGHHEQLERDAALAESGRLRTSQRPVPPGNVRLALVGPA